MSNTTNHENNGTVVIVKTTIESVETLAIALKECEKMYMRGFITEAHMLECQRYCFEEYMAYRTQPVAEPVAEAKPKRSRKAKAEPKAEPAKAEVKAEAKPKRSRKATTKAEPVAEAKPVEPKPFDRTAYEQCAEKLGVLKVFGDKRKVAKADRAKVYAEMAKLGYAVPVAK